MSQTGLVEKYKWTLMKTILTTYMAGDFNAEDTHKDDKRGIVYTPI
jgi:hypothetical protein